MSANGGEGDVIRDIDDAQPHKTPPQEKEPPNPVPVHNHAPKQHMNTTTTGRPNCRKPSVMIIVAQLETPPVRRRF